VTGTDIKLDLDRASRIGLPEAVLCEHKSAAQLSAILAQLAAAGQSGLLTRLDQARYDALSAAERAQVDYDPVSRTGFYAWSEVAGMRDQVAVVTAGSSDVPVAREALRTLQFSGIEALPVFDVGVAGMWRLLERLEELRRFPLLIVAAGMDAALPSVLGGLYGGLIVAVPTSTGYGVASGGRTALNAILASCASGVVCVNIDNGYGAACAALRALGATRPASEQSSAATQ